MSNVGSTAEILAETKVGQSPIPDGVYPGILREVQEEIAGALIIIF